MPEYLAPGVYVEEISSGNKPIQAASTSTAAMVGMTARGPAHRPTLVTSRGAFSRLFGGALHPDVFTGWRDSLPYAAEGFFTNGGARLYVVRVVGPAAAESTLRLVAQDTGVDGGTVLSVTANSGDTVILLADPSALTPDEKILIGSSTDSEVATIDDVEFEARPLLGDGLRNAFPAAASVTVQDHTVLAATLTAPLAAGAMQILLNDASGITADDVLLLRDDTDAASVDELVTVAAVDAAEKKLTLATPLRRAHGAATSLSSLVDGTTVLTLESAAEASGAPVLLDLDTPEVLSEGDVVRLTDGAGTEELAIVLVPQAVTLTDKLANNHPPGAAVTPVVGVLTVHARWPGVWGNSLRVTASAAALVTTKTVTNLAADGIFVTVSTAFGLHPGSIIVFEGGATVEVDAVDTVSGAVSLAQAPAVEIPAGASVTSREFSLLVERIENGKAVESETFTNLSMSARHPRYALTTVGSWDTAARLPSASGDSLLVRLSDQATSATRVLPLLPGVPRFLADGDDDVDGVGDAAYVGTSADDPDRRTGIQALENESTLSIVGVPGQTSLTVQQALVAHCEKMRYRFAVLDVPMKSKLEDARAHRQNFDTTRAAIYYPELLISDPFGAPGDRRIIPASGHVMGVYARTDLTRGVHKAPANEVIAGALALRTALTKGEQDIANPLNLNCLRDFRSENRGLRVYGARVATSDPEWKYVNVRRLLLFIESSLDTGLQWAVFEPNDKPLWDAVKQSVTGFLNTVWRSGALEGSKQEEAFFVNIGYDVTMTQTDIDNGMLVVEVGVAPVKPAEFVILRISQKTREATA